MKIKIKKLHENAVIPSYAMPGDAGMDLVAVSAVIHSSGDYIEYGTGIAIEIPEGYVGLLFPRSSLTKTKLILGNHVGVIDSGYRGEIKLRFKDLDMHLYEYDPDVLEAVQENRTNSNLPLLTGPDKHKVWVASESCYEVGDRIGQLLIMPYPTIELEEVSELTNTTRSSGGFGSTGN
jgi:dUTP pyrophosphatase